MSDAALIESALTEADLPPTEDELPYDDGEPMETQRHVLQGPDVVIELLSASTAQNDKTDNKQVYQDRLRVPEYFWYNPFSGELAGFSLQQGQYTPIEPDTDGRLTSHQLQLKLARWQGIYAGVEATWLRWTTLDNVILPTAEEAAEEEHQRAEQERQRAEELEARLARYKKQFGDLPE